MTGLVCPFCSEFHEFRKGIQIIAFACPQIGGIVHLPFFTKENIEEMKREAMPLSYRNIFKAFLS